MDFTEARRGKSSRYGDDVELTVCCTLVDDGSHRHVELRVAACGGDVCRLSFAGEY